LAAGALVDAICFSDVSARNMNDSAVAARREWRQMCEAARAAGRTVVQHLAIELRDTLGGRNLLSIGLEHDLVDCAQIDALDVVPELDIAAWRIRSA
jgi:phosphosulfolactate phosphohydrolase-like enzyme